MAVTKDIENPSSVQSNQQYLDYLKWYHQLNAEISNGVKSKRTHRALVGAFLAEWESKQA